MAAAAGDEEVLAGINEAAAERLASRRLRQLDTGYEATLRAEDERKREEHDLAARVAATGRPPMTLAEEAAELRARGELPGPVANGAAGGGAAAAAAGERKVPEAAKPEPLGEERVRTIKEIMAGVKVRVPPWAAELEAGGAGAGDVVAAAAGAAREETAEERKRRAKREKRRRKRRERAAKARADAGGGGGGEGRGDGDERDGSAPTL